MSLAQLAQDHFNLTLTAQQQEQFAQYAHELLDWNTRMNLTAITDPHMVEVRHFLDSLSLVSILSFDDGDKLIDVGTGAGFPGLALAIAFPHLKVTLLEATNKKLVFIQHVVTTLGLDNVKTVHGRAEDIGQLTQHRAIYDIVTARAVARLPILLEYMLPLAKVNGFCVAMKGNTAESEIQDSREALRVLGGEVQPLAEISLPQVEDKHYLVTVIKHKKTPGAYPRKAGIPTKLPLGTSEA
jgi:16S rRNA (guanine527-N7)-methyltransferase